MNDTQAATVEPAPLPRKDPKDLRNWNEFFLYVVVFAALLFLAAFLIWLVDRWRRRADRAEAVSFSLTNYREMYEAGELTQEEYEKIRTKMAGKMKADLGLSPPLPPPPKSE